jgi:CRISPR/Cas system Type II protein with McrA/HNH and RuvC-like nuclease domain
VLVVAWQIEEHVRVQNEARAALVNRAKDISTTMGIVLRSQRRFGGVVSKERLEASLTELANQEKTELSGIALLNEAGEVVASAGTAIDPANFGPLAAVHHHLFCRHFRLSASGWPGATFPRLPNCKSASSAPAN